ncbi:MAG TPA: NAD(P)H-binding protein [Mycobacterium sp.]|nr:NAD(P)H-binding protein [Mycobacterium sp.]
MRVLARRDDERAAALRTRGASTVIGDLHDRSTIVPAVDGVAAVYFTYPIDTGVVSAAANLASALVESGQRPHVVVMSMAASSHASPSRLRQAQAVAEELLMWAGLNPTILRVGALFHENVLLLHVLHAQSIFDHGVISNSFGSARVPGSLRQTPANSRCSSC